MEIKRREEKSEQRNDQATLLGSHLPESPEEKSEGESAEAPAAAASEISAMGSPSSEKPRNLRSSEVSSRPNAWRNMASIRRSRAAVMAVFDTMRL